MPNANEQIINRIKYICEAEGIPFYVLDLVTKIPTGGLCDLFEQNDSVPHDMIDRIAEFLMVDTAMLTGEIPLKIPKEHCLRDLFWENLIERMLQFGVSAGELSESLGESPDYISDLFSHAEGFPNSDVFTAILSALNLSLEDAFRPSIKTVDNGEGEPSHVSFESAIASNTFIREDGRRYTSINGFFYPVEGTKTYDQSSPNREEKVLSRKATTYRFRRLRYRLYEICRDEKLPLYCLMALAGEKNYESITKVEHLSREQFTPEYLEKYAKILGVTVEDLEGKGPVDLPARATYGDLFADNISYLLEESGMTRTECMQKAGLVTSGAASSQNYILANIAANATIPMDPGISTSLANAFGLQLQDLLSWDLMFSREQQMKKQTEIIERLEDADVVTSKSFPKNLKALCQAETLPIEWAFSLIGIDDQDYVKQLLRPNRPIPVPVISKMAALLGVNEDALLQAELPEAPDRDNFTVVFQRNVEAILKKRGIPWLSFCAKFCHAKTGPAAFENFMSSDNGLTRRFSVAKSIRDGFSDLPLKDLLQRPDTQAAETDGDGGAPAIQMKIKMKHPAQLPSASPTTPHKPAQRPSRPPVRTPTKDIPAPVAEERREKECLSSLMSRLGQTHLDVAARCSYFPSVVAKFLSGAAAMSEQDVKTICKGYNITEAQFYAMPECNNPTVPCQQVAAATPCPVEETDLHQPEREVDHSEETESLLDTTDTTVDTACNEPDSTAIGTRPTGARPATELYPEAVTPARKPPQEVPSSMPLTTTAMVSFALRGFALKYRIASWSAVQKKSGVSEYRIKACLANERSLTSAEIEKLCYAYNLEPAQFLALSKAPIGLDPDLLSPLTGAIFGTNLRYQLRTKDISYLDLSKLTNISEKSILAFLENLSPAGPTGSQVERIADTLDINSVDLFACAEDPRAADDIFQEVKQLLDTMGPVQMDKLYHQACLAGLIQGRNS